MVLEVALVVVEARIPFNPSIVNKWILNDDNDDGID